MGLVVMKLIELIKVAQVKINLCDTDQKFQESLQKENMRKGTIFVEKVYLSVDIYLQIGFSELLAIVLSFILLPNSDGESGVVDCVYTRYYYFDFLKKLLKNQFSHHFFLLSFQSYCNRPRPCLLYSQIVACTVKISSFGKLLRQSKGMRYIIKQEILLWRSFILKKKYNRLLRFIKDEFILLNFYILLQHKIFL